MRDVVISLLVFGSIPFILTRPYIGVLMWSWISYMNPHRLTWTFAYYLPFAQVIALATLVALLLSKEKKKIPWTRETIILVIFILWMVLTTIFSLYPSLAIVQLEKVVKIQLMTFITLMLMINRERIDLLIWVIVLSLGFYGIKGGIFTIGTGGGFRVMGPAQSFIGGNNEMGLALIMIVPLMRYLQLQARQAWLRSGWIVAIVLTLIAILGTQSRGAFVGIIAMGVFLIYKSRKRWILLLLAALMIPLTYAVMSESWFERMQTIETYEVDRSVQGRFKSWQYAFDYALRHPLGGGYEMFVGKHDAHSIYFEVLGEHGFVGLTLFLLLGWFTWRTGSWIMQQTRNRDSLKWTHDLAAMIQVSLVGYASSGAFLGLAYFDLFYHLVAIMVLCKVIVAGEIRSYNQSDLSPETDLQPSRINPANPNVL